MALAVEQLPVLEGRDVPLSMTLVPYSLTLHGLCPRSCAGCAWTNDSTGTALSTHRCGQTDAV